MKAIRESHLRCLDSLKEHSNLALRLSKLNSDIDDIGSQFEKDKMLLAMTYYTMSSEQRTSYTYLFNRWQQSMQQQADCVTFDMKTSTKALLGIGNASVHEFGVSLSYPMGVPFITGTSIKGLLSSYLARHGGKLWQRSQSDSQKSEWQVELFGGDLKQQEQVKSYIGSVIFNDAWLVPDGTRWFTPDIITPHYKSYYSGSHMPDGMDNPIPIKIAALRPGITFTVAIQGPDKAIKLLLPVLEQALMEEGLGAKTAIGYGRFEMLAPAKDTINDFIENKGTLLHQAAEHKEKEQQQERFDALSDNKKVLANLEKSLNDLAVTIDRERIKSEINKIIKAAEADIENWLRKEREELAEFMDNYYTIIGWAEKGITSARKVKQEARKRARINLVKPPAD